MTDDERPQRPSLRSSLANWRAYDASFLTKLRLALRNNWTKLRRMDNCCGNEGQPGC
jgi:hypothetical protein